MKKKILSRPAETQLNHMTGDLSKHHPAMSEHRILADLKAAERRKRVMGRVSDVLCVLAFAVAGLAVGASLALQI